MIGASLILQRCSIMWRMEGICWYQEIRPHQESSALKQQFDQCGISQLEHHFLPAWAANIDFSLYYFKSQVSWNSWMSLECYSTNGQHSIPSRQRLWNIEGKLWKQFQQWNPYLSNVHILKKLGYLLRRLHCSNERIMPSSNDLLLLPNSCEFSP